MPVTPLAQLGELAEGAALPEHRIVPTVIQVARFFGGTGMVILIFIDPEAARLTGLRGPVVPAEMKSGYLHSYLRQLAKPSGAVLHLQSAFRRPDYHGNPLVIGGQITRTVQRDQGQEVHLELWITQPGGACSVRSSAVLQLP